MNPLVLGLLVGTAFGAVLVLSGLSRPRLILDMLRLKDLHLLKALVTALATGVVGIALLDAAGLAHTGVKTFHLLGVGVGGIVFGVGFALAGYCPGTALAGAAEGRGDAPLVVLGGLAGTGLYALAHDGLRPLLLDPLTFGKPTIPSVLGVHPLLVALPLGAAAAWGILRWRLGEQVAEASPGSGPGPGDGTRVRAAPRRTSGEAPRKRV